MVPNANEIDTANGIPVTATILENTQSTILLEHPEITQIPRIHSRPEDALASGASEQYVLLFFVNLWNLRNLRIDPSSEKFSLLEMMRRTADVNMWSSSDAWNSGAKCQERYSLGL